MEIKKLLVFVGFMGLCFSNAGFAFQNPIWGFPQSSDKNIGIDSFRILAVNDSIMDSLYEESSRGQNVLGYEPARRLLMGRIYLENVDGEYAIKDVYCQKYFTRRDFPKGGSIGPDLIPDGTHLNTEHTWPQSRFTHQFPNEMQKSDLHHLFPSDSGMNSIRGNYKFADLAEPTIPVKCQTSRFAKTGIGYRFEPPVEHRGNVARAIFYFSARYRIHIDNDEEVYLRKWNYEDPVDQTELNHHQMIVQYQGNHNPFVENPDIVNQILDF